MQQEDAPPGGLGDGKSMSATDSDGDNSRILFPRIELAKLDLAFCAHLSLTKLITNKGEIEKEGTWLAWLKDIERTA